VRRDLSRLDVCATLLQDVVHFISSSPRHCSRDSVPFLHTSIHDALPRRSPVRRRLPEPALPSKLNPRHDIIHSDWRRTSLFWAAFLTQKPRSPRRLQNNPLCRVFTRGPIPRCSGRDRAVDVLISPTNLSDKAPADNVHTCATEGSLTHTIKNVRKCWTTHKGGRGSKSGSLLAQGVGSLDGAGLGYFSLCEWTSFYADCVQARCRSVVRESKQLFVMGIYALLPTPGVRTVI